MSNRRDRWFINRRERKERKEVFPLRSLRSLRSLRLPYPLRGPVPPRHKRTAREIESQRQRRRLRESDARRGHHRPASSPEFFHVRIRRDEHRRARIAEIAAVETAR